MTMHADRQRTYVLVPGAWMGAWVWDGVADGLRSRGHRVHTLTLSGRSPDDDVANIGLQTHVGEVISLLNDRDLRDVILVGHSYSGIVVGQVADRTPDRVAHTVFIQAFVPSDGRSLIDDWSDDAKARQGEIDAITENGGRWPAPPAEGLAAEPDLTAAQQQWLAERFVGQPGRTVTEPAIMTRGAEELSATYIACVGENNDVTLSAPVTAASQGSSWTVLSLRAGHWPMVSIPTELVEVLDSLVVPS